MDLTDAQVSEFQRLYRERFGEDLNEAEAKGRALKLLELVHLVYRPLKRSDVIKPKR